MRIRMLDKCGEIDLEILDLTFRLTALLLAPHYTKPINI